MLKKVIILFFLLRCFYIFSQEEARNKTSSFVDLSYLYGNIARHNTDIYHLITGHPEGFLLSWNKKTVGNKEWEQLYNYPDYGVSITYQDFKNDYTVSNWGVYGHYNFYALKRNLLFRIGQGIGVSTKPYDKKDNYRNVAFGSKILSSTYLMMNYKKERIFKRFGFQTGVTLIHYSNGNVKAPNTSINTISFNVGLNYQLDATDPEYIIDKNLTNKFTEPIRYNFEFKTGINESDAIGSGQYSLYVFSFYADKRLNKKSAIQLGTDVFYANFLKEYIKLMSVAYPELGIGGTEDYKRTGVFIGHELFVNRLSVVAQVGYYVYSPFDYDGLIYLRGGLKGYLTKNKKLFSTISIKAHAAQAEAIEFGIGYRL